MATLSPRQQPRPRSTSAPHVHTMATLPPDSSRAVTPAPARGTTRGGWDRFRPAPSSPASQQQDSAQSIPYVHPSPSTAPAPWHNTMAPPATWQTPGWQSPYTRTPPHRPSLSAQSHSGAPPSATVNSSSPHPPVESAEERDLRLAFAASQEAFEMDKIRRESANAEAERLQMQQARQLSERDAEERAVMDAITREAEERMSRGKGKAKMTHDEREALELATAMSLSIQDAKARGMILPQPTGHQPVPSSSARPSGSHQRPTTRTSIPTVSAVAHAERPHPHIIIPTSSSGDASQPRLGTLVPRLSLRPAPSSHEQSSASDFTRPQHLSSRLIPQDTVQSFNVNYDDAPPAYEDHAQATEVARPIITSASAPTLNVAQVMPPPSRAPPMPPRPVRRVSTPNAPTVSNLTPSPPSSQQLVPPSAVAPMRPLPPVPVPQMAEVTRPNEEWRRSTIVPSLLGTSGRVSLGPIWPQQPPSEDSTSVIPAIRNHGADDPFSDTHSVAQSVAAFASSGATLGVASPNYSQSSDDLRLQRPVASDVGDLPPPPIRRAVSHHKPVDLWERSHVHNDGSGRPGDVGGWTWTEDDDDEDDEVRAALERARSITFDPRRRRPVRRVASDEVASSASSVDGQSIAAHNDAVTAPTTSNSHSKQSVVTPATSIHPASPILLEAEDQLDPHQSFLLEDDRYDRPVGFQANPTADVSLIEGVEYGIPRVGHDGLEGSGSFPDHIELSSQSGPVFVLEAWTWNRLLAYCMWHGRSSIQASVDDLARETLPFHVSLSVQFTQAQSDGHTRVRLLLELVKPSTSPHRSRFLNRTGSLTSSRAPPGIRTCPVTGYLSTTSPSSTAVALNSLIVLPKPYLELPVEMSVLASALHEVYLVARKNLSSHTSRLRGTKVTANSVALSTLANSIEANAKENGELGGSTTSSSAGQSSDGSGGQDERLTKRGREWLKRKGLGLVGQSGGRLSERVAGDGLPLPAGASLVTPFDSDAW